MSREIKFRAWEHNRKKMVYGYAAFIGDAEQNGYPLMQYTGLKDKNGKDIYEGDILSFDDDPVGVVKWNLDFSCFTYHEVYEKDEVFDWAQLLKSDCKFYIIHGNIYENPELLQP